MTTPITLTIPIEMTEAQVIRANPALKAQALVIAEELHAMIAAMRPRPQPDPAFESQDAVDAVRRTVLGFWPTGKAAAAKEGVWVMEQLTCGSDGLHNNFSPYDRYLRSVSG